MSMQNLQHFIFTPKYRKPIFADQKTAAECESLIRHIAALKQIHIEAISVQPDHVHVFAEIGKIPLPKVAYHLKWFSSCWLKKKFPHIRAFAESTSSERAVWGVRYFYRSVGGDSRTVRKYIEEQSAR